MPLKPPAGTPKPPRKTPIRKPNNPKIPYKFQCQGAYAPPKLPLYRP